MISGRGSDCLKVEDTEQTVQKQLLVPGGLLLWMAGVLALVPVSWVVPNTMQEFWDEDIPGDALLSGWFVGFLYNSRDLSTPLHNPLIVWPSVSRASMQCQICKTPSNIWKWKTLKRVDLRFSDFSLLRYNQKGLLNRQVTVYRIGGDRLFLAK